MATAGDSVTVTGHNWLPGQQTVTIVVLPCSAICQEKPVADTQVASDSDGAFSQSLTILAGAVSGAYYAQATNAGATLSAISAPLQVAGQTAPGGTPLPGSTPTTSATRTSSDTGASQPPSQTNAALKDALLAAGLGLLVLLLLLGAITIFIVRGRSTEPTTPKAAKGEQREETSPAPPGRAIWRAAGTAPPDAQADAEKPRQMLQPLLPRQREQAMEEHQTANLPSSSLPTIPGDGDNYPWKQPTGRRASRPSAYRPDTGAGQRIMPAQTPADRQEEQ
jgi:hypothetical protein